MRKFIAIGLVLVMATVAIAAPELLGTKQLNKNAFVYQTIWAHPKSNTTGLMNTTGATTSYNVPLCDTGSMVFDTITGTAIRNVAMQVGYANDPLNPTTVTFTNAVGTDSAPYHSLDPGDSDTYKYDFNSRGFTEWRLNCLAGCDLTNTISSVYGVCWRSGK